MQESLFFPILPINANLNLRLRFVIRISVLKQQLYKGLIIIRQLFNVLLYIEIRELFLFCQIGTHLIAAKLRFLTYQKVKNSSSLKISFKLLLEKLHTCQIPIARSYPESSVLFFSEHFSEIFRKHEAFRIINQCILNKHLSICGISLCLTQDARKDTIIPNSGMFDKHWDACLFESPKIFAKIRILWLVLTRMHLEL